MIIFAQLIMIAMLTILTKLLKQKIDDDQKTRNNNDRDGGHFNYFI